MNKANIRGGGNSFIPPPPNLAVGGQSPPSPPPPMESETRGLGLELGLETCRLGLAPMDLTISES